MSDVYGLFDSFLESAATLAVLFIIVAWVSSKVVELWQTTFNIHGRILRRELQRCFGDKDDEFTRYFYWHPMIEPLTQPSWLVDRWRAFRATGPIRWLRGRRWLARLFRPGDSMAHYPQGRLPGYIAPESFAAVIVNPFPWPTTREALQHLLRGNLKKAGDPAMPEDFDERLAAFADNEGVAVLADKVINAVQPDRHGVETNPEGDKSDQHAVAATKTWRDLLEQEVKGSSTFFKEGFLSSLVEVYSWPPPREMTLPDRFKRVLRGNELIPHPLEARILTLLQDADGDMEEFRAGLRRWYAEAMNRVTSRFRRGAMIGVFVVALAIAIGFNLNSIKLLGALMANPELRAAGVAASRAIAPESGGVEALSQKVAFSAEYAKCAKPGGIPAKECRPQLLRRLWRDSGTDNATDRLRWETPAPPPQSHSGRVAATPPAQVSAPPPAVTQPALTGADAVRRDQVARVKDFCRENPGQCSPAFVAKLTPCAPNSDAGACGPAWDAIWSSSGFFWNPEAAGQLAASLLPNAPDDKDLPGLLKRVSDQASAEVVTVRDVVTKLSSFGPVWKDPDLNALPGVIAVIVGILATAALAALGAPFWYDVLGRISGRGSAARKKEG
jgi:hypothetical protein